MMKKIRYVVLAGNYREFRNWIADNNINQDETLYVSSPEKLWGRRFNRDEVKFINCGTWRNRKDILEIMETRWY